MFTQIAGYLMAQANQHIKCICHSHPRMKKRLVKYYKDPGLVKSSHFIGKASGSKKEVTLPITHCTPSFVLQFWYLLLPLSFFSPRERKEEDQANVIGFLFVFWVETASCVMVDQMSCRKVLSSSSSFGSVQDPEIRTWSPPTA